jgi:probable phosphoglycerate mutase
VVTTLDRIAHRHVGETIVVVSHGLVLDALYRTATRMTLDAPRGFPLLNCSLNTFRRGPEGWLAVSVCDVTHLGGDEVTRFSDANV